MITNLLKSLSDTELTAIAKELNNPEIENISIYKQLMSKVNPDQVIEHGSFIGELREDRSRDYNQIDTAITNLACKVALELSERLLVRDKSVVGEN